MTRRWKRSDITDEMVCRAYLPQMERARREIEERGELTLGQILQKAFERCLHLEDPHLPDDYADEVLRLETGAPWKVIHAAIYRAADRDLIDYGVSARTGWLTDKGKALIHAEADEVEGDLRG